MEAENKRAKAIYQSQRTAVFRWNRSRRKATNIATRAPVPDELVTARCADELTVVPACPAYKMINKL